MSTGIYSGVSAMRASERRLESITGNLANTSTPAYKRRSAVSHGFEVGTGDRRHLEVATVYNVDFTQGRIERTGNTYDVALMGDGFFAVDGPGGEMYTRNGSFHVDDQGVLLTSEGFPVAMASQIRNVDPFDTPVVIDASGALLQGNNEIARLKVVDFSRRDLLRPDTNGYYQAGPAVQPEPANAEVHQYALESSNASSIDELIAMITVQRAFESASNMMSMLDQSYRELNRAGR